MKIKYFLFSIPITIMLFTQTIFGATLTPISSKMVDKSTLVRTYEFASDAKIPTDFEKDFIQDGYDFKQSDVEKTPITNTDSIDATYVAKKSTTTQNKDTNMTLFDDTYSYTDDNGYSGDLKLDPTTYSIKTTGYTTKWYTKTDTKYYYKLPNTDRANILKAVTESDINMALSDVIFINSSNANVQTEANTSIGNLYTAKATYSGKYSKKVPTSFEASITYMGSATKTTTTKIDVDVTYLGTLVPVPTPVKVAAPKQHSIVVPIVAGTTGTGGILGAFVFFFFFKKNVRVRAMENGNFKTVGYLKASENSLVLDFTKFKTTTNMFEVTLLGNLSSKLEGKELQLVLNEKKLSHVVIKAEKDYTFTIG